MATMNPNFTTERRHLPERRSESGRTMHRHMNAVDWIAMALLIIGGINWGLVGLMGLDLVATVFGEMTIASRTVYALVGLSALYSIYTSSKMSHASR